jgi:acetylornithine deacetylase/succinyl-diaminopimelate desuccinylase-like protein
MRDEITVTAVGSIRVRAKITGPGGHPWSDRDHPNAVHGLLLRLASAITELSSPELAINVNVIGGGTAINVIADTATAEVDLRCEDEQRLTAAADTLCELLAAGEGAAAGDGGLTVEIERVGHRPGGRIPPDHPLLAAARSARAVAGLPPATESASSTDANAAHGRGIPAITVGVTSGGNAHRLDDYIDIAPIAAGLRSLEELARQLASDPEL